MWWHWGEKIGVHIAANYFDNNVITTYIIIIFIWPYLGSKLIRTIITLLFFFCFVSKIVIPPCTEHTIHFAFIVAEYLQPEAIPFYLYTGDVFSVSHQTTSLCDSQA
jgi:hypothetical protein